MPRTSVLQHPPRHPFIPIRRWQVDMLGNPVESALLSLFEYWHNVKLDMRPIAQRENAIAEMHGEEPAQNTTLYQHHTEDELEDALMGIAKRRKIREAIKSLQNKDLIEVRRNPNPRYKFDRTKHYLFKPEAAQALIDQWSETLEKLHPAKMPIRSSTETGSNGENAGPCGENAGPCGENAGTIPEITSEITKEIKPPHTPQRGDCDRDLENPQSEDTGNQQTPLSDQQAKKSGKCEVGKSSGARKKKSAAERRAAALEGITPEQQQQCKDTYAWYVKHVCSLGDAEPGSDVEAYEAFRKLIDGDFQGLGIEKFREGCRLFMARKRKNPIGIPHCHRFLLTKSTGSSFWQDALNNAKPEGDPNAFLPNADRHGSPPIFVAKPLERSQPPPGWAEHYRSQMKPAIPLSTREGSASA